MTTALLLYYALIVLWLPLLWPAFGARGGTRIWLLVVAAAGLLATLHEIRMVFWTTEAIRLDIILIALLLAGLYGSAVVVLFRGGRRKAAGTLTLALALIGTGMGYEWVSLGKESARLMADFHARNTLLFAAKFRSRETYEAVFGPFTGTRGDAFPVGHWQAQGNTSYRRLIVNAEGRIRLFYSCGRAECDYGSRGSALQGTGDGAANHWRATLRPHVAAPFEVRLARAPSGRLTLEARGVTVQFSKAPPPISARPAQQTLAFLGRFAALQCRGNHAKVDQLWLWMGRGSKDGDRWKFQWRRGKSWDASLAIEGDKVILNRTRSGRKPEHTVLERRTIFTDEAIDLAPLTTAKDWAHWFSVVFTGHFTSGDIPTC
jgi:hypothetical protein